MEFYFIRHGETEWNVNYKIQGQNDSPLTSKGITQAKKTGKKLKNIKFDAFYASDLSRAYKTAEFIASFQKKLPVIKDVRLRERKFGILEGLTHDEIQEQYPDIWEKLHTEDANYAVPGGESKANILNRTLNFIDELKVQNKYNRIIVVTHGGIINLLVRHIMGIPLCNERHFSLNNGSINIINFNSKGLNVKTLGDVNHLEPDDNHTLPDE